MSAHEVDFGVPSYETLRSLSGLELVIDRGRRMATADGRFLDHDGKLLAHGTTTGMIMPLREAAAAS